MDSILNSTLDLNMGIAILANVIAKDMSDEDLALIGAVLQQLGDTLTTIAAQREVIEYRRRLRYDRAYASLNKDNCCD